MKTTPRSNTGPGRSKRHGTARTRPGQTESNRTETPNHDEPEVVKRTPIGSTATRRAFILILVLVVLGLSYANTIRIYIGQQHELAVVEQQIRERSAKIAELEAELDRWNDPEFVKTQARERLGWVMPGETGFKVVADNGEPIAAGVVIEAENQKSDQEQGATWWGRLLGSIQTADAPARKVVNR